MKKIIYIVSSLVCLAFFITGCGTNQKSKDNTSSSSKNYPLTISNFAKEEGATQWTKSKQTFNNPPKSVVANTQPMAELLLHLGLKDSISGVGAVFGDSDESVAKDFSQLKQLGDAYISKEVALSVNPDLVFGRGGLFENSEYGVGTVSSLNQMGINTYVMETSIEGGTFNDVYKDIENLGKIFDVEKKATVFSETLKTRQDSLNKKLNKITDKKTFACFINNDPDDLTAWSLADDSFSLSLFKMLKLEHAFKETGAISVETLIETDPDVLIISKWDESDSAEKMVQGILSNPKVSNLKAVKNKAVYIANYNHLFGYSYQSLDGVELLAKDIYPDLF